MTDHMVTLQPDDHCPARVFASTRGFTGYGCVILNCACEAQFSDKCPLTKGDRLVVVIPKQETPKPERIEQKIDKALAKAELPPAISTAFTAEEVEMVKKVFAQCSDNPKAINMVAAATKLPLRKVNLILKAIAVKAVK